VDIKKWCKSASRLKRKGVKKRVGSTADESRYTNDNRIQAGALSEEWKVSVIQNVEICVEDGSEKILSGMTR